MNLKCYMYGYRTSGAGFCRYCRRGGLGYLSLSSACASSKVESLSRGGVPGPCFVTHISRASASAATSKAVNTDAV